MRQVDSHVCGGKCSHLCSIFQTGCQTIFEVIVFLWDDDKKQPVRKRRRNTKESIEGNLRNEEYGDTWSKGRRKFLVGLHQHPRALIINAYFRSWSRMAERQTLHNFEAHSNWRTAELGDTGSLGKALASELCHWRKNGNVNKQTSTSTSYH